MASADTTSTRGITRFSLRTLLLIVALFAGSLAVCRWNITFGLCLAVVLAGVICVVFGVRARRRAATILGVLLALGALGFAGLNSLTFVAWAGGRKLDVYVMVVDASSLAPVPGAKVQILHGPYSPIEGWTPDVESDFEIVELPYNSEDLITDQRGHTRFTHRFFAGGSYGMLRDSGYVRTNDVWLRVSSTGYVTTILPLDRQSIRPRDIHDQTPLCVTVPVGKR